jgi:hypothetical protein
MSEVTFLTTPSTFSPLNFVYERPYQRVSEVRTETGRFPLPRINYDDLYEVNESTFEMSSVATRSLEKYIKDCYFARTVRNCHQFAMHMAGVTVNYRQAMIRLDRQLRQNTQLAETTQPGDIVTIAHPKYSFHDHGGICIAHSMLVLDETHVLQLAGLGGPLGIATQADVLQEYQSMTLNIDPKYWLTAPPTTASDVQIYQTGLNANYPSGF